MVVVRRGRRNGNRGPMIFPTIRGTLQLLKESKSDIWIEGKVFGSIEKTMKNKVQNRRKMDQRNLLKKDSKFLEETIEGVHNEE